MTDDDDDEDFKAFAELGDDDGEQNLEPDIADNPHPVGDPEAMKGRIKSVRKAYGTWDGMDQRTNRALYSALGAIHEACAHVVGLARDELIREVRRHPDVGKSNIWDPYLQKPISLFLTMLFGLKSKKATKSQWGRLLKGADEAGIERTQKAFFDWAVAIGGINGIYNHGSSRANDDALRETKVKALAKDLAIEDLDPNDPDPERTIRAPAIPKPSGGDDFPQGLALVIVRRAKGGFESLYTLTNAALLVKALKTWKWEMTCAEHQMGAAQRERKEAYDKLMNHMWKEYVKKHGTNGYDKQDFADEHHEEVQQLINEGYRHEGKKQR